MIVGAAGASLVAMVMRICAANPKLAAQHELALKIAARADGLRVALSAGRLADEAAFEAVVAAQSLPKPSPERAERLEAALTAAALEPLSGMERAVELLHLIIDALAIRNPNLVSDLGCAGEFASAALNACAYNVRVNHRFMKDRQTIDSQAQTVARYEREAWAAVQAIRSAVSGELVS